jgi:subtilase-type serine protease
MQGVAYQATLVPIAYPVDPTNNVETAVNTGASGFDYARLQGVKIINNSWGTANGSFALYTPADRDRLYAEQALFIDAMKRYVDAGGLVVFAAGNEAQPSVEGEPGLPIPFPELEKGWLAVVATNNAGTNLASYSSQCGDAKNWCLAAPASEGDLSDYAVTTQPVDADNPFAGLGRIPDGPYAPFYGTSGAAPIVSGTAALVAEQFPWMTGHQLQQTLLTTATDLGDYGVDDVYGWGLVNAGDAVKGPKRFTEDWVVNVTPGTYTFSNDIYSGYPLVFGDEAYGLTKEGQGTLILEGSGLYGGDTVVNAGKLVVNSPFLSSDVFVNDGGTLGGSGGIGRVAVNSGGTLAPGNSIGNLYVDNGVTFKSGSTYEVEANVAGEADVLESDSDVVIEPGSTFAFKLERGVYDPLVTSSGSVIQADNVSGTFTNVTSNRAFFSPVLSYDSQDLTLSVEKKAFASVTTTQNQSGVAAALQNVGTTGSAAFNTLMDDFLWTPSGQEAQVRQSFQSLSGETSVNLPRVAQNTTQMINRKLKTRMDGYDAGAVGLQGNMAAGAAEQTDNAAETGEPSPQRGVWMYALGTKGDTDSDGNSVGYEDNATGLVLGVDREVSKDWVVGLGGAYTQSNVNFDASADTGEVNTGYVNAYTRYDQDAWTVKGILGYGHSRYDSQRYVTVNGQTYAPQGDTNGDQVYSSVEGSYDIPLSETASIQPLAGLNAGWLNRDAYDETGGGPTDLRIGSDIIRSTSSDLGARVTQDVKVSSGLLRLEAKALWNHEFGDASTKASSSFVAAPAASFDVAGVEANRDGAVLGTGIMYQMNNDLDLYINYDADIRGSDQTSQSVFGGLRVRF